MLPSSHRACPKAILHPRPVHFMMSRCGEIAFTFEWVGHIPQERHMELRAVFIMKTVFFETKNTVFKSKNIFFPVATVCEIAIMVICYEPQRTVGK